MPTASRSASDPLAAFRAHLDSVRHEVDARLEAVWNDTIAELKQYGDPVVQMAGAGRDLTLRGGKRFRAGMLVAAYEGVAPRASKEPALAAAVSLELLQSYLLMQDDWMDGDAVRRGGPSAHAALSQAFSSNHFGACSAILASDLALGLSVRTLASTRVNATRRLRALEILCSINRDVVAGQQLDMLGRASDVEVVHQLKTGSYTVRGPLLVGATLAGAPKRTLTALARYAEPLGVAFQLRDDLLGVYAKEAETGKREGNDLRAGKRTALVAAAEGLMSAEDRAALARALGHADASEEDVQAAAAALTRCGARAVVEERLTALCAESAAIARELPVSARARRILSGAVSALLPS